MGIALLVLAATISRVEGRCCRVGGLWLSGLNCFDRSRRQWDLESEL